MIVFPDFLDIMHACQEKMKEAYKKYDNSWLHFQGLKFWKGRLDGEIDEIWQAKTLDEYQREILDAINVLCMMYDRPDDWIFSEEFRESLKK